MFRTSTMVRVVRSLLIVHILEDSRFISLHYRTCRWKKNHIEIGSEKLTVLKLQLQLVCESLRNSFASFFHCRFISSVLEFLCLQLTVYAGRGRSSFGLIFKRFGSCSCSSWCAVVTRLVRVSVQLGVSRS
ncbi:uncharacterized protein LOC127118970 isoform X1 [Lathyrus oleraceus]|uniref:uncharacterized protein LOC127118970 isoform X1 n=1 Tax=Pisum sativum TaxID=3888 RepID=UPI0021D154C1|nr:uncharacterized protein LOC127118970 isoform X1 [Pisum sativum]